MALDYRSEYQRYRRYYTYLGPIIKNPIFRAYFSVVMSIFTVAIFIAFAIRPTLATIVGLQKQIEDKQNYNRRLDEKINSLSQLQSDYQAVERDLPLVFTALPQDPAVSEAVILLEKTATAAGVVLTNLSIPKADYSQMPLASGAAIASTSSQAVKVSVKISGGFDNLKNFFERLGNLPRIFFPDDTGVNKQTQEQGLDSQSTVSVYYLP